MNKPFIQNKRLSLVKDDAGNQDKWRSLTTGNGPTLPQCGNESVVHYGLRSLDVKVSSSSRMSRYLWGLLSDSVYILNALLDTKPIPW